MRVGGRVAAGDDTGGAGEVDVSGRDAACGWAMALLTASGACGGPAAAPPPPLPPCLAKSVTAGVSGTWVLKEDGSAWYWGYSDPPPKSLPPVESTWIPSDTADIFLRSNMMCILSSSDDLRCAASLSSQFCGRSDAGQTICATGGQPGATTMAIRDVVQVAMGPNEDPQHTVAALNCAVKKDGTVWCFGSTNDVAFVTQYIEIGSDVVTVATGLFATGAIKVDGTVWSWGTGYLGDGMPPYAANDPQPPVRVLLPSSARGIALGRDYACAVLDDNTVWCWGYRGFGSAFHQDYAPFLSPVQIGISDVKTVVMGSFHACALKNDGSLWCWGSDFYGEAGYGPGGYANSATWEVPRQVDLGNDVTMVAAGDSHTCARKSDATIWCWGNSSRGQIGNNLAVNTSPVQMLGCE